jgi:hypothetical protein
MKCVGKWVCVDGRRRRGDDAGETGDRKGRDEASSSSTLRDLNAVV